MQNLQLVNLDSRNLDAICRIYEGQDELRLYVTKDAIRKGSDKKRIYTDDLRSLSTV